MTLSRTAATLLVAASLAACATTPRVGTDARTFEQRREVLQAVDSWQMRGRLTVDTGDRRGAFQGRFSWRQDARELELVVRSAIGAGVLQVVGPRDALQVTKGGETRTLVDPERELSELVGWWLPIGSLPGWLLGLPDPDFRAETQAGADGTLATLDQRLWHVAYPAYQLADAAGTAGDVLVPRRIDLSHEGLELRLTIDEWLPKNSASSP